MKKILLLFAAVCCMMAANAQQFTDASGIKYNVTSTENNTVEVIANGYSGAVVIPATVEYNDVTYRVTSISSYAFQTCGGLTSITLPSSVTSIGESAFSDCTSLSSVSLPSGLTSIGEKAFENCLSLSSVSLPSGLTSIGERAFLSCTRLSSIAVFAPNPPALGTDAFASIPSNATVRVPNGKIDSYRSAWENYSYGFQFAELTTDDYRQQALCEINGAMQGVELTAEEQTAIYDYIQTITNAEDITAIENAKEAALAFIRLKPDRTEAIAAIEAAMQGETGAYITGLVQQYVSIINAATDVTAINNARDTALTAVTIYKAGKSEALGTLGTECEGCPAIRVTKGEKEIILYAPEKVEIIKIPANTNN